PVVSAAAKQEIQRLLAVAQPRECVDQSGALQVALHQPGVAVIILGQDNVQGLGGAHAAVSRGRGWGIAGGGSATKKGEPTPGVEKSQTWPPCRSTTRRTSANPTPSPGAASG